MNRNDVEGLSAGKEMDVTVGYHVLDTPAHPNWYGNYSTAWEDMRMVVERMRRLGWTFRMCSGETDYHVWFEKTVQIIQRPEDERPDLVYHATAETAPLAVCRAALLAVKGIIA